MASTRYLSAPTGARARRVSRTMKNEAADRREERREARMRARIANLIERVMGGWRRQWATDAGGVA